MDAATREELLVRFSETFPVDGKFFFTKDRISKINRNRTLLDGSLFFDVLLTDIARIDDVPNLYPPRSLSTLRSLFFAIDQIDEAHLDRLKKYSFYYYILKDFDRAQEPGSDCAVQYSRKRLIPANFCALIDGLYCMDNFEFEEAVSYLTAPSVTAIAPQKILITLLQYSTPQLLVAFVTITSPTLDTDLAVTTYFTALLRISVEEAFMYQRTVPTHLRQRLFTALIDHSLTVKKEVNALALVNLPFTEEEGVWFNKHLKESNLPAAADTLIVKQMHTGRLSEALELAGSAVYQNDEQLGGVNWGYLARGLELGIGPRAEAEELGSS